MFLETCSYYREPGKAKVFLTYFNYQLQPYDNVIHHHVSVLVMAA